MWRLDRAPTRAYEANVGARTTYRLLPVESAGFHEGREKILYQVESEEQLTQLLVGIYICMQPTPTRLGLRLGLALTLT